MTYDDWVTMDPEDRAYCEEHDAIRPCRQCRMESLERAYDDLMERRMLNAD